MNSRVEERICQWTEDDTRKLLERIEVNVSRAYGAGGMYLPDPYGSDKIVAWFKTMTFGDNLVIEEQCTYEEEVDEGPSTKSIDYNEMRRLSLKRCLVDWSLDDIIIERENGWVRDDNFKHICALPGPLIEALLDKFWDGIDVAKEEETEINKQAAILFGKHGRGVANACEAVRLYCNYSGFSDKFGLDGERVRELPYREYLRLKIMLGHEHEAMRRQSKQSKEPVTRIAGKGGRTRQSRGKRIPL